MFAQGRLDEVIDMSPGSADYYRGYFLRDDQALRNLLADLERLPRDAYVTLSVSGTTRDAAYARILELLDRREEARAYWQEAAIEMRQSALAAANHPDSRTRPHAFYALAYVLAALGQTDEADETLAHADALAGEARGFTSILMGFQVSAAKVLATLGQAELAVERLRLVWAHPCSISIEELELDPIWDPIRDHPLFEQFLDDYRDVRIAPSPFSPV